MSPTGPRPVRNLYIRVPERTSDSGIHGRTTAHNTSDKTTLTKPRTPKIPVGPRPYRDLCYQTPQTDLSRTKNHTDFRPQRPRSDYHLFWVSGHDDTNLSTISLGLRTPKPDGTLSPLRLQTLTIPQRFRIPKPSTGLPPLLNFKSQRPRSDRDTTRTWNHNEPTRTSTPSIPTVLPLLSDFE